MELFITLTKEMGEPTYGRTLAVSHHVLEFEACSACPASKVLCWTFGWILGACSAATLAVSILFCVRVFHRKLHVKAPPTN